MATSLTGLVNLAGRVAPSAPATTGLSATSGFSVGAGLSGVGTGLQIGASLVGALESRRIGRYNARVAQANAQQDAFNTINEAQQEERLASLIDLEIDILQEVSAFNEARLSEDVQRREGRAVAAVGASGLAFEGSPIAAIEEHARQGHIQVLAHRYQTAMQVRALEEEATQRRHAATVARFFAGDRLRLGTQQATLFEAAGQQGMQAGFAGALQAGARGAARVFGGTTSRAVPGRITRAEGLT